MAKKDDDGKAAMNGSQNDKREELSAELFEQYLDGESSVSEAYRELGQAEPSAALDHAILSEAQDAVRPKQMSLFDLDLRFWRHWGKPLTTVVIMGVCLTVVLRVMDYETLVPAPSLDTELATAEQKLSRPAQSEPGAALGTGTSADAQAPAALYSKEYARRVKPDSDSPTGPTTPMAADMPNESILEEITITARKRSENLQEVPLASSDSQGEEIVVTARRSLEQASEADRYARADDALEAWQQGARPAADVWLAGIAAVYSKDESLDEINSYSFDEPDNADIETAKMARVYPGDTRRNEERHERLAAEDAETMDYDVQIAEMRDAENESASGADSAVVNEAATLLADPVVWAAGIEWLYENNRDDEAEAELEKLRRIYPDFEMD